MEGVFRGGGGRRGAGAGGHREEGELRAAEPARWRGAARMFGGVVPERLDLLRERGAEESRREVGRVDGGGWMAVRRIQRAAARCGGAGGGEGEGCHGVR